MDEFEKANAAKLIGMVTGKPARCTIDVLAEAGYEIRKIEKRVDPCAAALQRDFVDVLNRHCRENESNTPDRLLAQVLVETLAAFDRAVNAREQWYGRTGSITVIDLERVRAVLRELPRKQREEERRYEGLSSPTPEDVSVAQRELDEAWTEMLIAEMVVSR